MRNFKKVMALAISVAAVCSSVSAFAADLDYAYTGDLANNVAAYDASEHTLTLDVEGAAGDKTVLVLDKDVEDTAATGDDILYINQYTASETAYDAMGLKGTGLAVGTYAVKFGYTDSEGKFAIKEGAIVVTEKQAQTQKVTFVLGDVDNSGATNGTDAGYIVTKLLGGSATVGTSQVAIGEEIAPGYKLGDVDASGATNGTDAGYIVTKLLGGSATVGTSGYAIGELVTVEVPVN